MPFCPKCEEVRLGTFYQCLKCGSNLETDIFLSEKVFVGLILSSIAVYKKECLGSLLGYKTQRRVVVEYALPFQSAERKPTEVEPNWKRESKVRETIGKLMQLQHLGYFHSHTQWGKEPTSAEQSATDRDSMNTSEIDVVVALNEAKRVRKWRLSGRILCGSINKYHIQIAGYYKTKKDEIRDYGIFCPYALGFDYHS
jgi:proteasome lid subunit RPN8/RPN11